MKQLVRREKDRIWRKLNRKLSKKELYNKRKVKLQLLLLLQLQLLRRRKRRNLVKMKDLLKEVKESMMMAMKMMILWFPMKIQGIRRRKGRKTQKDRKKILRIQRIWSRQKPHLLKGKLRILRNQKQLFQLLLRKVLKNQCWPFLKTRM